MDKKTKKTESEKAEDEKFPLPKYPAKEDIYSQEEEEPFDEQGPEQKLNNALDEGLDVPGADLDDENEVIGEEDEENNYYSLGGDNHNDLDEDNGE